MIDLSCCNYHSCLQEVLVSFAPLRESVRMQEGVPGNRRGNTPDHLGESGQVTMVAILGTSCIPEKEATMTHPGDSQCASTLFRIEQF
jgi:hypothetical protein